MPSDWGLALTDSGGGILDWTNYEKASGDHNFAIPEITIGASHPFKSGLAGHHLADGDVQQFMRCEFTLQEQFSQNEGNSLAPGIGRNARENASRAKRDKAAP
jgi:hypothetical protein